MSLTSYRTALLRYICYYVAETGLEPASILVMHQLSYQITLLGKLFSFLVAEAGFEPAHFWV